MTSAVDRARRRRAIVYAASAASFVLGLFFVFVWSPLPWGWTGIDYYYDIALSLAHGGTFATTNIMWGYAYFLAFWYRLFGDHPWVPLTAQVVLNASIPILLFHLTRIELGERVAVIAAVLAGLFSFNTLYAATQASDSVCTVLVVAMMLAFAIGARDRRTLPFVLAGALSGLAFQFRPNLILLPFFLAGGYIAARDRSWRGVRQMTAFAAVFMLVGVPWVVRNYRWTGLFIPASTHGGIQLWFGTLQTGEYQDSWLYNPRAAFEYSPIDYSSLDRLPPVVTARASPCEPSEERRIEFVYWTNRDAAERRLPVDSGSDNAISFTLPVQSSGTAVHYRFDVTVRDGQRTLSAALPPGSGVAPPLFVMSTDHLGDLDADQSALDVFDLVRMARHIYWGEPLPVRERLDLDGDGTVAETDLRRAAALLADDHSPADEVVDPIARIDHGEDAITILYRDRSQMTIPRSAIHTISDVRLRDAITGTAAAEVVKHSRTFASLGPDYEAAKRRTERLMTDRCLGIHEIAINHATYRLLPHEMRRYDALALDNIRAAPLAYAWSSLVRAVRVFVVQGSTDRRTAIQLRGGVWIYRLGAMASAAYLLLFAAGLVVAIQRRLPLFVLVAPIVYVPLTVCFMLINARYSMTIQPFVFALIAVAVDAGLDRRRGPRP